MAEPVEAAPKRSELEEIQFQSNKVTDDSLESTRRMVALCEESKEAGIRTLVALDDQGEKLEKIDKDMNQINADMKVADKMLKDMEKFCGICSCPCNNSSGVKEDADYEQVWKGTNDGKVVSNQPARVMGDQNGPVGGYIAKYSKDGREDEMEENMLQVNTMIGNLRNMAIDMGTEIDSQNDLIETINKKGLSNIHHVANANERTGNLLKD